MLKHLRPMLALSVLLLATAAEGPALARSVGLAHPGPRIVRVPGFVPRSPFGLAGQRRRHQFARRSRNQSGFGDFPAAVYDPNALTYPTSGVAPQEAGAADQPYVIDAAPRYRPAPNPGPLIITLPDLPKGAASGGGKTVIVGSPRAATAPRRAWRRGFAHGGYRWDWRGFAARARAYHPSPLALIPCSFGRPGAIYNTPCGIYRYE
jgi:hypothetical protein